MFTQHVASNLEIWADDDGFVANIFKISSEMTKVVLTYYLTKNKLVFQACKISMWRDGEIHSIGIISS